MVRVIGRNRAMLTVGCALLTLALLAWPQAAASGISRGLSLCGDVLIPSLFPFLAVGGVLTRSGAAAAIGRRVSPLTTRLFGLPGCAAPVLVIGMVGGYPAGAAAVAQLYKDGALTRDEGRQLLRFCVCAGPGFAVNAVGVRLMNNRTFGWILLAAHLLAALLIGLLSPRTRQRSTTAVAVAPAPPVSIALVQAITATCETMLYLCGFVLLFSAVLSLCNASGLTTLIDGRYWLPCLLEVGNGCAAAANSPYAVALLGFALGFGGLSVHCQIAAATRGTDLMSPSFFTARLAHGVGGALFTSLLCRLFPSIAPVFGSTDISVATVSEGRAAVSVCLLVLCGIWLLVIPTGFSRKDVL